MADLRPDLSKIIYCCLGTFLLLSLTAGQVAMAAEDHVPPPADLQRLDHRDQPAGSATVIFSRVVPEVDGNYDAVWDRIHIYPLLRLIDGSSDEPPGSVDEASDLVAGFQVLHDTEHVYGLVRVIDDAPRPSGADGDRILLSFGPTGGVPRTQFDLPTNGAAPDQTEETGFRYSLGNAPPAGHASWPSLSGYTVEFSLPLSELNVPNAESAGFGFNVHVTDVDGEGVDETVWRWASAILSGGAEHLPLGSAQLADSYVAGSVNGFLPTQVWQEVAGAAIVEAEMIDHHSNWVFEQSPKGFTGTGFLSWQGPDRTLPAPPFLRRSNDEYSNERLGPQNEWLIVRLAIENPGTYMVDLRNFHQLEDGDNDVWFGLIGQPFGPDAPITRMGDNLKSAESFSWLDWGVQEIELDRGVHSIFIGGRSVDFGVDRIAIYRKGDAAARARALDPLTQASPAIAN